MTDRLDPTEIYAMSHWDDIPDYPVEDWQYEVANGDTRLGYKEWALNKNAQECD